MNEKLTKKEEALINLKDDMISFIEEFCKIEDSEQYIIKSFKLNPFQKKVLESLLRNHLSKYDVRSHQRLINRRK